MWRHITASQVSALVIATETVNLWLAADKADFVRDRIHQRDVSQDMQRAAAHRH